MYGVGGRGGSRRITLTRAAGAVAVATALLALSACGGSGSGSSADGKGAKVALILKEFTNPYWISMEKSAKAEAAKRGVSLQVSAGKSDDDTTSQINQIDEAIAAGDKGIIIALNGDAVNSALQQAKSAGLVVVALDTPPIPSSVANVTYATDNTQAGTLDGRWMAAKLGGGKADIAMLDDLANQVITVDIDRDHGFLNGMGIPVGNKNLNGAEPKSGHYTGGKGGSYKIACQLATNGSETGGQSAMETCLSKDSSINVVYAINEPAAEGAAKALKAAGRKDVTVVAIDGGCSNLPFVSSGEIGASAGQAPGTMAKDGVDAIATFARSGTKPTNQQGQDFYNTGTKLYTDSPQTGVPSITSAAASKVCWG
ncbi:substrate-binding domain-containing protein [Streptomyces sp. SL13]|uniref:Substrate-binding domain-containing protein n=1 Tax=Streptantibioticus silvisoli TaxID=2705255 RepID=A0AA90K836_9ACTN|nr:substrate-binding domain-containing protein [Streptantibioticus silvisoli]MDI5968997.1 substrate-binding domain-containing protein [Streptantibioticus silvisoli]